MFDGYLRFGGTELINAARTAAYLHNRLPQFPYVRRTSRYDTLPAALGDEPYRSPFLDEADWIETATDSPGIITNASHNFFGLYPLEIQGVSDSTMTADVIEGILDGGTVNSERDETRSIRVRGLLVGADELAVEAGMTWLRNALRTNTCGMHGDGCGYQDLRYFLAPPDVCDPKWTPYYQGGDTFQFGPITPDTTPVEFVHGVEGQPYSYEWILPPTDGVQFTWGARAFDGSEVLEQYGPVYLRRSNYVPNPRFFIDTSSWSATSGTIARVDDGVNTYGHADKTSPVTYRTNWLPDPSFENGDPNDLGWRASADITAPVDGTAPQGTHVAVVGTQVGGNWFEASMLGPFDDNVTGTLSFWKRQDSDITVTVADNAGAIVFTSDLTGLTDAWARVSVASVPMKKDYVVRLSTDGTKEIRVDGFLLEAVGSMGTYFDGDTPDGGGVDYYFAPTPAGPSRGATGSYGAFSVETAETDAPFGDAVLSFKMRATESTPTVTVELLDPDDVVLGSVVIAPTTTWTRTALGVTYGRKARARFASSTGAFDLDEVMIEPTVVVNDYFDGSSAAPSSEYAVSWVSAPHNSISRMTWTGSTLIERQDNWRPFLDLLEGSLQSSELSYSFAGEIEMEFQLDSYDRTYHEVYCTVGPQLIKRYELEVGAAWQVDFVLTAANPHAFSTVGLQSYPSFDDAETISDDLINLVINPSAEATSAAVTIYTNLIANPSGETATTGYVSVPGTTGVAAITNPTSTTAFGVKVLRNTWSTASTAAGGGMTYGSLANTPVTVGVTYCFYVGHIKSSITNRLRLSVSWYTSGSVLIGSPTLDSEFVATAATVYTKSLAGLVAPATAAYAVITVISVTGTSYANWSIASYLELDGLMMTANTVPPPAYFDGATAAGSLYSYAWSGTANASTSVQTAPNVAGWLTGASAFGGVRIDFRANSGALSRDHEYAAGFYTGPTSDGEWIFGPSDVYADKATVIAGVEYTASAYVSAAHNQRFYARLTFYTAANALISTHDGTASAYTPSMGYVRYSVTATAPALAVRARVVIVSASTGTGYLRFVTGSAVLVDDVMLTFGEAAYPYFDGATADTDAYDYAWLGTAELSASSRSLHVETASPLVDPDLPVVPSPPTPPVIPDSAIVDQNNWLRYYHPIGAGEVAGWAYTIPTIALTTGSDDVRQVRVRFFPNPFGWTISEVDTTSYCGEFLLSYLPASSTLTVSGVSETAWAVVSGGAPVTANHLLYGTGGGPMEWPEMTCNIPYLMTVDIPPTTNIDNLSIELILNRRE